MAVGDWQTLFLGGKLIKSFEGVRGLAAVLVAMFHLYSLNLFSLKSSWFSAIINGYIFVDLFFVLSGYIIFTAYRDRLRSRAEIKIFIIRRFGRLFPLMVFASIAFVALHNVIAFSENYLNALGYNIRFGIPHYLIPSAMEIISTVTLTPSRYTQVWSGDLAEGSRN
jgi:peptidoglycan/LPS O-acetylase OafA/YrhL